VAHFENVKTFCKFKYFRHKKKIFAIFSIFFAKLVGTFYLKKFSLHVAIFPKFFGHIFKIVLAHFQNYEFSNFFQKLKYFGHIFKI
jgi:hypothetical protein